jgi:hypothetical protein
MFSSLSRKLSSPKSRIRKQSLILNGSLEALKDVDKLLKDLIQTIIQNMRKAKHMKDQLSEKEKIPQNTIIGEVVTL